MVAGSDATYVAMHWRAHADHMRDFASYDPEEGGVVSVVREELARRVDAIEAAGIDLDRVVLDPGLGFAKRPEHDWAVLRGLDVLHGLGLPLLVGASRKSFLGRLLGSRGALRPVTERDPATTALTTWLAVQPTPVWGIRVHDVRASRDALAVVDRLTTPLPTAPWRTPVTDEPFDTPRTSAARTSSPSPGSSASGTTASSTSSGATGRSS